MHLKKRWQLPKPVPPDIDRELQAYHPTLRQILFNREVLTAEQADSFLRAVPQSDTDPFLLTGMEKAVDRIRHAIQRGETIAVYGDYDADGVTATALLMQTLEALHAHARDYIPNRFDEGYGLNHDALTDLKQSGVDLVITVDCGIRALAEAEHARSIGLEMIITDHHNPGPELPHTLATINPKQPGDRYPDKNLAGVGTAYKLACALLTEMRANGFDAESLLDLVAIGTVADLVPLRGENRALVREGLRRLRTPSRQGLFSLMQVAGIKAPQIRASDIGFGLGPRLNAAGRLDSARAAYELLTTRDVMHAGHLAQALDNHNRQRQQITRTIQEKAESIAVTGDEIPFLLFAADPEFNPGVVGLAASRLVERYHRPAVVGHRENEVTRASCRSIPGFHITQALDACADLLEKYGGHAAAAGFTVSNHNLIELMARLEAIAADKLDGKDLRPEIRIDAEVRFEHLSMDLLTELDRLQPTGMENPEPVFVSRGLTVKEKRLVGRDQSHLKLKLSRGGKTVDAIAFRQGHWYDQLPERLDVAFHFERNEFRGYITPQMNIRDIQPAQSDKIFS